MLKYSSYVAKNKANFALSQRAMRINFDLDADKENFNDTRLILKNGECEGAVVVSVFPLYVAAYATEMDAIVLLDFSDKKWESLNRGLFVKSRLLTVNGYEEDDKLKKRQSIQKDLIPTRNTTYQWQKVCPIITDFVVEEKDLLERIKKEFTEEYWNYIYELGNAYYQYNKGFARIGKPDSSQNAFFGIDVEDYYKKTYGDNYRDYMPARPRQKKNLSSAILIAVIGIIIYLVLLRFTDKDTASIFKTIFKILF